MAQQVRASAATSIQPGRPQDRRWQIMAVSQPAAAALRSAAGLCVAAKPLSDLRVLPRRSREETVFAGLAAKSQAPMMVADEAKFSAAIGAAIFEVSHETLRPIETWSAKRSDATSFVCQRERDPPRRPVPAKLRGSLYPARRLVACWACPSNLRFRANPATQLPFWRARRCAGDCPVQRLSAWVKALTS
jgi:hypothetical protein